MPIQHCSGEIIAQRYCILNILGNGGNGITYLAEDIITTKKVVLKTLSLQQLEDWKQVDLIDREATVLAQLDYPNIPKYLDYFTADSENNKIFYLVQELAPGESLVTWVESGWRTSESEVKQIAEQILNILIYLQQLEPPVIHRDIKPHNLIRSDDGSIFLVDFGAVRNTYYSTMMRGSTIVGTYGYMAPEQFIGQAYPATDLYGLGATLLYLLTHRSPSELPETELKIDVRACTQISNEFAWWLEKLLEPDVKDRFSSAKEALSNLHYPPAIAFRNKTCKRHKKIGLRLKIAGILGMGIVIFWRYQWTVLSAMGFFPRNICEDSQVMKDYLQRGGNPNMYVTDYSLEPRKTLLTCHITDRESIKLLITHGVNVNTGDEIPLYLASESGNKEVVELLIAHGANVNARGFYDFQQTPLFAAARSGNKGLVEVLIARGADINLKDSNGHTPMFAAVSSGNKEIIEFLIARGAGVNLKDYSGDNPLFVAARGGDKEVIEFLITRGVDINLKNHNGDSLLFAASDVEFNNKEVIEVLIARGIDINLKNHNGDNPLLAAVRHRNKEIVELLVARGADVNCKAFWGETLLAFARSQVKEIKELNLRKSNAYSTSDYQKAIEIVEILKKHGAQD